MNELESSRLAMAIRVILVGSFLARAPRADEPPPHGEIARYDCGTIALHTLLALEGRATHFEALQARLPVPGPQGHSMAELRDAARACGLTLTGVKLPRGDRAPDRPALVFLEREDHGHFLVVRPVGHSGKLVQVIDSTGDPIVMDAVDLYAQAKWTGLALVPVRPNWPLRIAVGLMVLSGFSFVLLLAASRSRAAREGVDRAPVSTDSGGVS